MNKKVIFCLPILAGLFWGSTGIFVRILTRLGLDNPTIILSRTFPAFLILFAYILIKDKNIIKISLLDLGLFVCLSLSAIIGINLCYNIAVNSVSLSLAGILLAMGPFCVIFFDRFLFNEAISMRKLAAVLLAFFGSFMVSGLLENPLSEFNIAGFLWGLGAAFFYASYAIFSKIAANRSYHSLTILFYLFGVSTIVLFFFADWDCLYYIVSTNPKENCFLLLLHCLFVVFLPYIFFTVAMKYLPAGDVAILSSTEPIAATVFGIFIYHESFSLLCLLGIISTIAAIILLNKK